MPLASRTFNRKHLTRNIFAGLLAVFVLLSTVNRQPLALNEAEGSTVFAQTPYEKAKSDYSIQLKKYNQARNDFITAKASYIGFQTAASKTDAFEKTRVYLTETNFLITNYLFIVREYGNKIDWQNSTIDKTDSFKAIEDELDFLQIQWGDIQKTTTLEELPPYAESLSKRLEESTEPNLAKATATFEIAKTEISLKKFNTLSQRLVAFAATRTTSQNRSIVNNWQSEISSIDSNTKTLLENSKVTLSKTKAEKSSTYKISQIAKDITSAKKELARPQNLFGEILNIL